MSDAPPPGWTWVAVNELAATPGDITDGPFGSNLKTEHYTEVGPGVIRLQNIGDGSFVMEDAHIAPSHFERLRKHEAIAGDVVVAMLGDELPRACLVPVSLGPAIVKADCVRLRPNVSLAEPTFVAAGLNSTVVRQQAKELTHGVGRPRLGLTLFRTLRFPLAPLAEQRRIVDAIDSHLSRLDAAVATLKAAQTKLKAYRASVLKAAVEGRLVPTEAALARAEKRDFEPADVLLKRILSERRRRWEQAELAKLKAAGKSPRDDKWKAAYEEPKPPDTKDLPELPEGWCWTSLGECFAVTVGATPSRGDPSYWGGDIPWVSSGEVAFCRIKGTTEKITQAGLDNSSTKVNPKGSVLVGMIGEGKTRGQTAILDIDACGNQNAAAIWVGATEIPPEYVYHYLVGQYEVTRRRSSGNNQPALNKSRVQSIALPLAPLSEQRRIVERLEEDMSVIANVEATTHADSKRIAKLRRSILKWAFEGRLVDQDPNDEPAEKLLARIRAERANGETPKRARRAGNAQ